MEPGEAYLRDVVLAAATDHGSLEVRLAALQAMGRPENAWAIDPLLELLAAPRDGAESRAALRQVARTLAAIGDPRVIPAMIAVIDADNTYDTVQAVGQLGLEKLTAVTYDESHDGPWWHQWWEKNQARFPVEVQRLEIPTLAEPAAPASRRAAVAKIAVQDLLAGGDRHKRYFLIGPYDTDHRPPDGLRLLLVLPGGDGGPDFRPFVENIFREATPDGYLVAELVAPQWSPEQANQVVWPTVGLPWAQARFTTEQFIDAVIDDIASRYQLDARYVFSLSWSSGGPAAYAASLADDSRITGSLVAMSVFKAELLPDLQRARGRRYYILHSPQDFIPMRFPEAARDQLAAGGASTTLVTYEGGHGWHGDVFGNIRRGLKWLQE